MRECNKARCDETLQNYITTLDRLGFEYLEGYKNCETPLKIKCVKCGTTKTVTGHWLKRKNYLICEECERREAERKRQLKRKAMKLKETKYEQREPLLLICAECGEPFFEFKKKPYCSKECTRKHNNRTHWNNRRATEKKVLVDKDISLERLIKRDNNVCYLCGNECNCNDYVMQGDTFIAGNYYPSIDHVQPLAKGGLHSWNNVRLAHRICNSRKSDGGYISPFIQK